jgi:hypothetical protein
VHAFLLTPCDDNHGNNRDCEDHAENAPATAQSRSRLVTQNPTTMTGSSPSPSERLGAVHGRLGRGGYQHAVPQSGIASKARAAQLASRTISNGEASYVTDDVMPFRLSGRCEVDQTNGRLNGYCIGARSCSQRLDCGNCPCRAKPQRYTRVCNVLVDAVRRCKP